MPKVNAFSAPHPKDRLSREQYRELRAWLLDNDPDATKMVTWASHEIGAPQTPEQMASQIIWIILCAGRNAQAARTIEGTVWTAIHAGKPVVEAFGHRGKAAAIEQAWSDRLDLFTSLQSVVEAGEVGALVAWCGDRPYVGDATKFQLAKNFGAQICKPDIWLCRLAGIPDVPHRASKITFPVCMQLCNYLGAEVGDNPAVVDSVLWLACNKGILRVGNDAGPVKFSPQVSKMRSIFEAG